MVVSEFEGELEFWVNWVSDIGGMVKCKQRFMGSTLSGDDALIGKRAIVGILINAWIVLLIFRFSRYTDDLLVTEGSNQLFLGSINISGVMLVPSS